MTCVRSNKVTMHDSLIQTLVTLCNPLSVVDDTPLLES